MDMIQQKAKLPKDLLLYAVVLLMACLSVVMSIFAPFKEVEYFTEDLLYQRGKTIPNNIKIIAIDETSLSALGPYNSWDRSVFASLLNILNQDDLRRPSVIAMDIIFSGMNDSEADMSLVMAATKYPNVLLASKLELADHVTKQDDSYFRQVYVLSETGAFEPLDTACAKGFTTPIFDEDGYTRRAYGRILSDGKEYTGFALQTAILAGYQGPFPEVYEFAYSGNPGDFEIIPMSMVLDGTVNPSYFNDAIVLVGAYAEGLMDAYSVPINHAAPMYGVEIQANEIAALLSGHLFHRTPLWIQCLFSFLIILGIGYLLSRMDVKKGSLLTVASLLFYLLVCILLSAATSYLIPVLYVPVALLLLFVVLLIVRHSIGQRERAQEMQRILFSMADSMAEAIEGRTPYNANHTKNVAKRCMEMLDYINTLYAQKKTQLHFSKKDKRQLYLAAMLHDIGKMDIPLDVMDKPTRLGSKINALTDRLTILSLRFKLDALEGRKSEDEAKKQTDDIDKFLSELDSYDCGRPLKEDEIRFIDDMASRFYEDESGNKTPYLTEAELDDLHIKAGTLSDAEREMMKSHVVFTDRILSHVYFGQEFDKVRAMASDHHELLNGKGYPQNKEASGLDVMTRILTIMDIYDSLIADDRPYKKPKSVAVAFEILDEEAAAGKIDKELLQFAKELYL